MEVKLLTTTQAILRCKVQGKPIDRKTFFKLADLAKVKRQSLGNGQYIWTEDDVERMRNKLPKKRGNPGDPFF